MLDQESGTSRSPGKAGEIGDLGHREPEGVVEDEHRPLLRRQAPEAAVQLVSVVDGQDLVEGSRRARLEQDDVGFPAPATPGLGVARST